MKYAVARFVVPGEGVSHASKADRQAGRQVAHRPSRLARMELMNLQLMDGSVDTNGGSPKAMRMLRFHFTFVILS